MSAFHVELMTVSIGLLVTVKTVLFCVRLIFQPIEPIFQGSETEKIII